MTINLEKELIKANQKLVTPEQLLYIKEYDKFTAFVENDALKRLGLSESIKSGKSLKDNLNKLKDETSMFKQERVFHISQIKSICEKYYLKFLSADRYNGIIDDQLPTKITNFEAAYNVKCSPNNTMICAPSESFNLEPKPKDPLLFYKINSEYYYLIHKWGNDLSIFRRMKSILSSQLYSMLLAILISLSCATPVLLIPHIGVGLYILLTFTFGWIIKFKLMVEDEMYFFENNRWNSEYQN